MSKSQVIYRVTASVTFDYDPRDGLVSNADEAREDVLGMIATGDLNSSDFDLTVTAVRA